jgi:ribosome-interacting GTPase 1
MPANLPPMYFEAEKRFRDGKTPEEKIEALEEMLAIMPEHKGTEKLKYARVRGKGVYDGQMVQRDYVLQEGDVAEFPV